MSQAFLDTPINRATIEDIPVSKLNKFIEHLQERRLRTYNVYQAAQEARLNKELDETHALLDKRLGQFIKKLAQVDKNLADLEKYAVEILSARMALGHKII